MNGLLLNHPLPWYLGDDIDVTGVFVFLCDSRGIEICRAKNPSSLLELRNFVEDLCTPLPDEEIESFFEFCDSQDLDAAEMTP